MRQFANASFRCRRGRVYSNTIIHFFYLYTYIHMYPLEPQFPNILQARGFKRGIVPGSACAGGRTAREVAEAAGHESAAALLQGREEEEALEAEAASQEGPSKQREASRRHSISSGDG